MAEFTAEQVEQVDLSDFTAAQRSEIVSALYAIAPGSDSLGKRRWVADRLRCRISEVNRALWAVHGIRWSLRPLKKPARQRAQEKPSSGVLDELPDLSFTLDDLRL